MWRRILCRRGIRRLAALLATSFATLGLLAFLASDVYYNSPPPPRNYFVPEDEYSSLGHIVNTVNCHILNISAFHTSILPLLNGSTPGGLNCRGRDGVKQWTYVDAMKKILILNETALHSSGYSISSISCCYRSILRINQPLSNYGMDADSLIDISSTCRPLTGVVTSLSTPGDDFIRVSCTSKYWPFSGDTVYRAFHAAPFLQNDTVSSKRRAKLGWRRAEKKSSSHGDEDDESKMVSSSSAPPPNVILLGIDSMSRLSFERNMPKTRQTLKKLGAVEFYGYTKLGENTYPNAISFMTGYSSQDKLSTLKDDELSSSPEVEDESSSQPEVMARKEMDFGPCDFADSTKSLDSCPFAWKDFAKAGYLTAFLEDAPYLATYNYDKVGFLRPPVDFYLRPFMLGVSKLVARKAYYYLECLGGETVDELIHRYIRDILAGGRSVGLPAFIYAWLTNLAHGDLNGAQSGDEIYADFLKSLDLNDTILFFISDHGYRYGPIRQTFAGWYEDKLPNFWVYLPPGIRASHPKWADALALNAGRLTSPLDLHATLTHIMTTFSTSGAMQTEKSRRSTSTSRGGLSFFRPIPSDRKCSDAGIPENFCACEIPQKLEVRDPRLVSAALVALSELNNRLPKKKCAPLFLSSIHAGGLVRSSFSDSSGPSTSGSGRNNETIIVAFYTTPGGFLFEGNVQKVGETSLTLTGELLRMNKISRDASCVGGDLEKFCYCH